MSTLLRTEVRENVARVHGGGISLVGGTVDASGGTIESNESELYAGGIGLVSSTDDAVVRLDGVEVRGNVGEYGGGAMIHLDATLSCEGSTRDSGGFLANEGGFGGGVLFYGSGSLRSTVCDWGEDGTGDDNTPNDIASFSVPGDTVGEYGDDADFTCDDSSCTDG